jgi:hypothetical protein
MRYSPKYARLAQLVEHFLDVDGVGGSNPSPRTFVYKTVGFESRRPAGQGGITQNRSNDLWVINPTPCNQISIMTDGAEITPNQASYYKFLISASRDFYVFTAFCGFISVGRDDHALTDLSQPDRLGVE